MDNKVNELVDMLDRLMSDGGGHVNVITSEDSDEMTVQTYRSSDCGTGQKACCQPTLNNGMDCEGYEDEEF